MILVLGVIVQYGLNFDFRQQGAMQAYRQALAAATQTTLEGTPTGVSHIIIEERHIPNPANPLALGSMVPIISSASSPARSHLMDQTADTVSELPRAIMTVNGESINCDEGSDHGPGCVIAGFREEVVPVKAVQKYNEIYGDSNVCGDVKENCGATFLPDGPGGCAVDLVPDLNTGALECPGQERLVNIEIIDSMEGEIFSQEAAERQCNMITNPDICISECERSRAPEDKRDCQEICNLEGMNTPWYCGKLDQLFGQHRTLGLQPGMTLTTSRGTTLTTEETPAGITNTATIDRWEETTDRDLVFHELGDTSGSVEPKTRTTTAHELERPIPPIWITSWED